MSDYLDASILVSLFVDDTHSPRALAFEAQDPDVVTSAWAVAEFSSALSFQVRIGRLTPMEREKAESDLDSWLARQPDPVVIAGGDFLLARDMLQTSRIALRAPDALHLAICLRIGASLATFDTRLAEAARAFGAALTTL